MSKDDFGDRMKLYEMSEAGRRLMPLLPAMARIDGRAFSSLTRHLQRPFDQRLSDLMIATTTFLVQETGAVCGYTQSDEISLAWLQPDFKNEIFFGGRIQKMVSQLAALATAYFVRRLPHVIPELAEKLPTFDCRVWNVPNVDEGANVFLWREKDATKNSISMAARHYYPHRELENKSSTEMQELLWQKGVNWNDYPAFFKRGTFVQKRVVTRRFTTDEIESLPPKHHARTNPDLEIERTEHMQLEMPPFSQVTNRPEVIFFGKVPQTNHHG